MRTLLATAVVAIAAVPILAQTAGDSIRFRVPPSSAWNYARFLALDSSLTVSQADTNRAYRVQSLGKVQVRTRKNPALTIIGSAVACVAGAGIGILVRPRDRKPLFGSDGAVLAVAAGAGLVVGVIEISVSPWYWKGIKLKASS